jgi:hypothetical protein
VGAGGTAGDRDGAGCGFSFVGNQTDPAEVHHSVIIRITRWHSSGPRRMTECLAAAEAAKASPPARHRTVDLRDQACLGPGAVVEVRAAQQHYTVAVIVNPRRADTRDEDVLLAPLSLAAARLVAGRFPAR